ncbi:cytochrome ubiquinol oxidase subunit I [Vulgatibacter incomptus]|uniref:Putative Cytochrome bd2, subunit I n=1 Tax=Vulgatibacter incomptus TaxID=1391653 RepID=A0A0K1PD43_9BACT|nr:cytochrome ubiquinol oxidase subunit I [Vulgatibacter incomptus]AKU91440.1 putative Cytochrome bd2, subunit I [Vulgatibacter incomptus]
MDDLLFARLQMAISLGFHIVFAAIGIAMPLLMVISEAAWLRTRDPDYLELTKAWAKGTAVLIAIGAASGTVLSFELGLLFPGFMRHAGAVIGMPFSLEGFAFFAEAIFVGIYLYGWNRVRPSLHLASGVVVAASGALSAVFVITANAWMNLPRGFRLEEGAFVDIDPVAAMTTPYAAHEIVHMLVAAYQATGILVAAIHAWILLRRPGSAVHRKALAISMAMVVPAALVQPLVGDWSAKQVAKYQPLKLAAMESQFKTETHAPLRILGIPDHQARETRLAIELPGMLSWLAYSDRNATVLGLEAFPENDWPSTTLHYAFQLMVLCGLLMFLLSLWAAISWIRRRRLPDRRAFLWCTVAAGPLGMAAIEFGWIVTEVGRQPWVIYGVMRTAHAVTPMPSLIIPLTISILVYLGLSAAVVAVLLRQIRIGPGMAATTPEAER